MSGCGLDLCASRWGPVAGRFGNGKEITDSIKCGQFLTSSRSALANQKGQGSMQSLHYLYARGSVKELRLTRLLGIAQLPQGVTGGTNNFTKTTI